MVCVVLGAGEIMAAKIIFVNQDDKAQSFKANLFGPEKNRVRVANVLAAFKSSVAIMEDGSTMEADDDGLSMDTFVAGGTYNLSLVPQEEGPPSKRRRVETPEHWQAFVQSAAKNYKEWEAAMKNGKNGKTDAEKDSAMKFLTVSGDPSLNFMKGYLLGIRECYIGLKKILEKPKRPGDCFIVLGTSGIGKSCFSVFWICHLAARKKKVVWKLHSNFYLLDFSDEAAKFDAQLEESDPKIQEVFRDRDAWLIIDGGQEGSIDCACHILVPCSDQKKNYAKFLKIQRFSVLYLPVWEEEEISQFVDAFEQHRLEYQHMDVPSKEEAIEKYALLGGVARYVLCSKKTAYRLEEQEQALRQLDAANCLKMLKDDFTALESTRDMLVHMTLGPITDDSKKYRQRDFKLASGRVKSQVIAALDKEYKADTVKILKALLSCTGARSYFGYIYELVGHYIFIGGGEFRRKRVHDGRDAEELNSLKLPKLTCHRFESLDTLPKLEADTYYYPKAGNFASIDAIMHPNRLLQFFNYSRGDHGYLVTGLEKVHARLGCDEYEVWSCVPKEKYEVTGFQSWLTSKGVKYKTNLLPTFLEKSDQYVIEVDFEKLGT
ncbi:hypothetical protein M758_10G103900 [Ceratodon purpureus]|nr:hypothetical protein M758_10G103900 [Ceratodon purpureus]